MLGNKDAVATLAVRDLAVAKKFYEGTLGLKQLGPENPEVLTYKAGGSKIFVYRSQYAGTNQATAATWTVGDDIEEIVHALEGRGVKFEHYDMPNVRHEGSLHIMKDMKAAWFKDTDGNILSLVSG